MKTPLKLILIAFASSAFAATYFPFTNWEDVKQRSPDIIIARCSSTPDPYNAPKGEPMREIRSGMIDSDGEVVFVLKGTTEPGPAHFRSRFHPRQGEHYLIFAHFHDGFYQANEEYRVVPLGIYFPTNILADKPLDEQVRVILKRRLDQLNRELERGLEEKKRLEGSQTKR